MAEPAVAPPGGSPLPIGRATRFEDLPELLRVPEAARWLGISEGLVYTLAASGALPSLRLGRLLRIPREGLLLRVVKQP